MFLNNKKYRLITWNGRVIEGCGCDLFLSLLNISKLELWWLGEVILVKTGETLAISKTNKYQ